MDGSNDPCFQSVVILGLKTALLEAQDEISRITKERDEARKKILQMIQTNGKYQVEVINSNELATKLKTELKKVRKELEAHKKELEKQKIDLENAQRQKENENYNWKFQYDQLKSLLDIKTELLESMNVKGDKLSKDDLIDYRANYKIIMKSLKMVVKNQPCYSDHELLEDIRNIIYRIESGRSVSLSKYFAKRAKPVKKEIEKSNDNLDSDVHENSRIHSSDPDSVDEFPIETHKSCENPNPNVVQSNFSMKMDDFFELDKSISKNTNFVADKANTVVDKPKINVCITDMPDLIDETVCGIVSAEPSDEKNIDTISDSESDSTSGFCDGETEAESPPSSTEFVNQPSDVPENHNFAMCMPDLLSSSDTEKNTFSFCRDDQNNISESSITVLNSKLKSNKSPSPRKKNPDTGNELQVKKILEEMKEMRIKMNDQVSVLRQYYDENLDELNSCFKRPESVLPSRRKSVQKSKNIQNVENVADAIPKRSSQLVKRDPCSRKVNIAVASFNDDEIREKRLDSGSPSHSNEIAMDSPAKSNLDRVAIESRVAEKRDVDEIRSGNSSLFADVTNNFETATDPLSQLLTEASFSDTIDLNNTFDYRIDVLSTDDAATVIETQEPTDKIIPSLNTPQTDVPENSNTETLPQITLKSNVCNSAESSCINRPLDDVTIEESDAVCEPSLDIISSQHASSSNVEKLDEVSTKENHAVTASCADQPTSTSNILNEPSKCSKTEKSKRKNHYADLVDEKRPQEDPTIENNKTAFQDRLDNVSTHNASSNKVEKSHEDSSKESNPVTDPVVAEQLTSTSNVSNRKSVEKSSKLLKTEKVKPNNRRADLVNEKQSLSSSNVENSREVPSEESNTVPDPSPGIASLVTDVSNEQPPTLNISNRNSDKKSSESCKTTKVKQETSDSDLVNEKPIEGASKKRKNPRKPTKPKQVSLSDDQQTQSTCEEANDRMAKLISSYEAVIAEVASSYVQEPVEESQVDIVSVPVSDVDPTPSSDSADATNENDLAMVSTATQQLADSSALITQTDAVILEASNESSILENNPAIDSNTIDEQIVEVPEKHQNRCPKTELKNLQNEDDPTETETEQSANSFTLSRNENAKILEHPEKPSIPENNAKSTSTDDSNPTDEKIPEDVPKKRQCRRPRKTLENLQNEDNPTEAETKQSTNSFTSSKNENASILEHPEKPSVPENNAKSTSTDDSNLAEEKIPEDVPKKRGRRPKKASCDAPEKTKTTSEKTVSVLENSNVSSVLENNTKSDSVDDSEVSKEETSEQVIKRRGRPKKVSRGRPRKVSLDSQHSSNKSTNASPAKAKRKGAIVEKPGKSSVLVMRLRSSPMKRKCGRPSKTPPAPKSEPRNSTKPDSDNVETTTRVSRRKSSRIVAENSDPSCTMNNGMERRKRKGKYVEILDSLKCKTKRRKSDYDAVSIELNDDVKPQQRRGRKRKASLPIETFESATQTNWSPSSKSTTSRDAKRINELEKATECEPESVVHLHEPSPQIIDNDRQIDKQIRPSNTNNDDRALDEISFKDTSTEPKQLEIPTEFNDLSILASRANQIKMTDLSMLPSSHPLPQFVEHMSKMIQEKVMSMIFAKSSPVTGENLVAAVESKRETAQNEIPSSSLSNVDPREPVPAAVEAGFVRNPSSVAECNVEINTVSSVRVSDDPKVTIPVAKSNLERAPELPDSSIESKHDQESISVPEIASTSQLEEIPAAKLAPDCVPNSSESENDTESDEKHGLETANRVIPVEESKKPSSPDVSDSSTKIENKKESISISSFQTTDQLNNGPKSESKIAEKFITVQTTNQSEAIPVSNRKEESISKRSESENDEESVEKSVQFVDQTVGASKTTKSEQTNVTSSTSTKLQSTATSCTMKSIFDCEADESPTKAVRKKVCFSIPEVSDERCDSPASMIDSDDDAPIEISSKMIPTSHTHSSNIDESSHLVENEPISRILRYEEEASNSSALSSHVSELDVNVELVSQFEGVRTPPKIKDLFDSSDDDENSKNDVFNIIEEMTSISRSLFERQKELAEFSLLRSPPLIESAVVPSPSKLQKYSPSRNTVAECQSLYSPSQNNISRDEDDSEDENWVIAEEDDLVNDSNVDGIEINKLNCNDTNPVCASPAYTKSLKPSNASYNSLSNQITNYNTGTGLYRQFNEPVSRRKVVDECPASSSNTVNLQYYKENVELENQGGTSRALSPFETVWQSLKSLYVKSADSGEEVNLISCECDQQSIARKAFFFRSQKPYVNRWDFTVEDDKMASVEKSIEKFLEYVRGNRYVRVKDFTESEEWTPTNSVTIATVLIDMVMKYSNRPMRELKETLGYLSNLSIDLETVHAGFVELLQTTLKEKIFSKTWKVDKTSSTNQVSCVIAMSVFFTMLSQRSNDVKSVKDLLFEGLYSWKYRVHQIAFGVLNACPTIFNDASRNCLLTQIILFTLINHSMKKNLDLFKVLEVREMIGQHYKVKLGDKAAEDYVKEAMLLFNDDTWVDAMVLLCHRKEFPWSYTNVIMKYLIQIVNKWKEENFNEMILIKTIQALSKIVQVCRFKDVISSNMTKKKMPANSNYPMYNIGSIIKSLSEVLYCEKGSRELRETVAIAICNISHLDFETCLNILSTWEPPECSISDKALEEMNVIMRRRPKPDSDSDPRVPNLWERTFSPRKPMRRTNQFVPRRFNGGAGGDSTMHQHQQQRQHQSPIPKFREKNSAFSEPPKKKKKKKKNKDCRPK
ncbi:titin-like isoform X2 [Planococcus citri]|uniref:titin-like isoform X2 n=1 Tax=Planococcus citri TaxID=170843 RepID=UPI0031F74431